MLNLFRIGEQVFHRTGTDTKATSNGRPVRLGVWESICPDCGASFRQRHRDRGLRPARSTLRRCPACRPHPLQRDPAAPCYTAGMFGSPRPDTTGGRYGAALPRGTHPPRPLWRAATVAVS